MALAAHPPPVRVVHPDRRGQLYGAYGLDKSVATFFVAGVVGQSVHRPEKLLNGAVASLVVVVQRPVDLLEEPVDLGFVLLGDSEVGPVPGIGDTRPLEQHGQFDPLFGQPFGQLVNELAGAFFLVLFSLFVGTFVCLPVEVPGRRPDLVVVARARARRPAQVHVGRRARRQYDLARRRYNAIGLVHGLDLAHLTARSDLGAGQGGQPPLFLGPGLQPGPGLSSSASVSASPAPGASRRHSTSAW